jgi:hypothetical protein
MVVGIDEPWDDELAGSVENFDPASGSMRGAMRSIIPLLIKRSAVSG